MLETSQRRLELSLKASQSLSGLPSSDCGQCAVTLVNAISSLSLCPPPGRALGSGWQRSGSNVEDTAYPSGVGSHLLVSGLIRL